MLELALKFVVEHPVATLVAALILFFCWLLASLISVMPPLPEGAGFFLQWAYNGAQIFGASLDKVGRLAARTTIVKELEKTLETSDGTHFSQAVKQTTSVAASVTPPNQPA
jgi:hypothetical protein